VIIVYAGVQPDVDGGRRRLPPEAVADIETRVRRLLSRLRPSGVLGAAAAGADLLVADAATRLGLPLHLILPHDRDTFRGTSVTPHGPDWERRYDRVLDVATVEEGSASSGDAAYRRHNQVMLDRAAALRGTDEQVWALVIRPPETAPTSVSDDFAERAAGRGFLTLDLNPLTTPAGRRRAFVAMPYGDKFDPVTRKTINCDVVFQRVYVPVLEDLDLEWQRADLEADSGLIHIDMIDALASADVVVVDLAAQNVNVAYELGLRHALVERSTVLTYPQLSNVRRAQAPPFDVQPIRHVRFGRSVEGMSDAQAADGIRELRRIVQGVLDVPEVDSPVEAWFVRDDAGRLRRRATLDATRAAGKEAWTVVQSALRSLSVEEMRAALEHVAQPQLSEDFRRKLRFELGMSLLRQGHHEDARRALAGAEPAPGHPLRSLWLQQSALLESWQGQRSADPLPYWERAEAKLAEALSEGDSEETCGILAGIAKRRCHRALAADERGQAAALLDRMTDLYRRGFHADPGYYAGVNLTAALRLGLQHFGLAGAEIEAWEALAVSRFYARRDQEDRPDEFWPAVTLAELALHAELLRGTPDTERITRAYHAAAALSAPAEWRRTAADQLRFFAACGDDPILVGTLVAIIDS
jgi:hypothetical protein